MAKVALAKSKKAKKKAFDGNDTEQKDTVPIQTYIDCANTYENSETKSRHESILNNTQ